MKTITVMEILLLIKKTKMEYEYRPQVAAQGESVGENCHDFWV